MKLSPPSARFLVTAITLGMGLALLLFSNYSKFAPAWLKLIDAVSLQSFFPPNYCVTDYDQASKTINVRTLGSHPENSRTFQDIAITDDPDHIFESAPPSPLDYAVILQKIYEQGYRSVIVTTRMTWDLDDRAADNSSDELNSSKLSAQALSYKLAQFDRSVIGLPVTRGATAQKLPATLQRSLISFDQVSGNKKLIPKVNQVTLPTTIDGGDHTHAGFHRIESTPKSDTAIPLLAQWENEGLIPSLELLAIMSAHDISPSDLSIQCGKFIRLGNAGPVIPIDGYGQTATPTTSTATPDRPPAAALNAEDLIRLKEVNAAKSNSLCILQATGKQSQSTGLVTEDRISKIKSLCENLPTPGKTIPLRRLPVGYEILIILVVAVIAGKVSSLQSKRRHINFGLTLLLVILHLAFLMYSTQQWFGLTAPAIAIITAWITASQMKVRIEPNPVQRN